MKERFTGVGRPLLLDALKAQKFVAGNAELADEVASIGETLDVAAGTAIIQQGGDDNDVYLIIAGSFDIVVNNKVVARCFPNDHVGEMAAIQPMQRRSASVVARESAVVVKLSEPQFAELSTKFPQILRYIAKELARRLDDILHRAADDRSL